MLLLQRLVTLNRGIRTLRGRESGNEFQLISCGPHRIVHSLEEPVEQVPWRIIEQTFGSGGLVGTYFQKIMDNCSSPEPGLRQTMVPVMEEAQMTVASLDSRA